MDQLAHFLLSTVYLRGFQSLPTEFTPHCTRTWDTTMFLRGGTHQTVLSPNTYSPRLIIRNGSVNESGHEEFALNKSPPGVTQFHNGLCSTTLALPNSLTAPKYYWYRQPKRKSRSPKSTHYSPTIPPPPCNASLNTYSATHTI